MIGLRKVNAKVSNSHGRVVAMSYKCSSVEATIAIGSRAIRPLSRGHHRSAVQEGRDRWQRISQKKGNSAFPFGPVLRQSGEGGAILDSAINIAKHVDSPLARAWSLANLIPAVKELRGDFAVTSQLAEAFAESISSLYERSRVIGRIALQCAMTGNARRRGT